MAIPGNIAGELEKTIIKIKNKKISESNTLLLFF